VEFAVKLPGQGEDNKEVVWIPIDAKFPREDYERLIEAQEQANRDDIEAAGKALEETVLCCAQKISEKYLAPPNTTDFGILFLPVEGLFAETIRRTALIDNIQQN
jgi:DNA recombination protein RmuC